MKLICMQNAMNKTLRCLPCIMFSCVLKFFKAPLIFQLTAVINVRLKVLHAYKLLSIGHNVGCFGEGFENLRRKYLYLHYICMFIDGDTTGG